MYEVNYMDNSFTKGVLLLETLTLGGTGVLSVVVGCGHSNKGLVTAANGLLGLGGGPLSLPTQLRLHGLAGIFSYCLPDSAQDSLGWLNFSLPSAMVHAGTAWIPLLRNPNTPTFYYVGLSGLGIGDARLLIPENTFKLTEKGSGGVIIDSGTTFSHLPTPVYEIFRDTYVAKTVNILPRFSFEHPVFDTCFNLSGLESVQVPNVSFFFSAGPILTLKKGNILVQQEPIFGESIFCLAFVPTNYTMFIIGSTQLAGIETSFDTTAGYIGFGPNTCGSPENSPFCHGLWPTRSRSIALGNYIPPNPFLLVCLFICFYL
jgi:hypothetical protein